MKKTRIIALIMAIALILSAAQLFAFASAETENTCDCGKTFVFAEGVSAETQEKVIAAICGEETTGAQTRGLTCDLFGHNLETGTSYAYSHKVRSTAPRCLMETYYYENCSRCDYATATLLDSEYINCCS